MGKLAYDRKVIDVQYTSRNVTHLGLSSDSEDDSTRSSGIDGSGDLRVTNPVAS